MINFLEGTEILKSARKMIKDAESADLAIAYWGVGALKSLGIDGSKPVRILCDLLRGSCNPLEIKLLLEAAAQRNGAAQTLRSATHQSIFVS